MESGYYPPGAENDPSAPYNQVDTYRQADVCISQTLSRECSIEIKNDCTPREAYEEQEFTIPELLAELEEYIKDDLEQTSELSGKGRHLKALLSACRGWIVDETEIIEE